MINTELLHGCSLINGEWTPGDNGAITGFNPATNEALSPSYSLAGPAQLEAATTAAAAAFTSYRETTPEERAAFLATIADNIEARRPDIVERAILESGLPAPRLNGELSRTTNQLRLFASTLLAGGHHRVRIDPAQPAREPQPRVDLRQRMIPLGPVGVFGASNFPLAFSTAGGDTTAALAAGCPVVFKAHNAHPGTGELVAQAISRAIDSHNLHPGVFNLVYGQGAEIGQQLAADPRIKAIGFTGSRRAGLALSATAFKRPVPIPVYAEMSAINPAVIFPGAINDTQNSAELATGFTTAVTGSSGQLCTKPGLLFVPRGVAGDAFISVLCSQFQKMVGETMLTKGIADARNTGVAELAAQEGVETLVSGIAGAGENAPAPVLFTADFQILKRNPVLQEEIFGAASLIIRYDSPTQLHEAAELMEGQLTATIHADNSDFPEVSLLLPKLEDLAGRILFGGWPTGVEVGHAVVHGGPFPATSDSRTSSVGTLAIERFTRPVAYQSFPDSLRPVPLTEENPWQVPRLVEGV